MKNLYILLAVIISYSNFAQQLEQIHCNNYIQDLHCGENFIVIYSHDFIKGETDKIFKREYNGNIVNITPNEEIGIVNDILVSNNDIYLACSKGLYKFDNIGWTKILFGWTKSLAIDNDGDLWASKSINCYEYKDSQWLEYNTGAYASIAFDNNNQLWGISFLGLMKYEQGTSDDLVFPGEFNELFIDSYNNAWLGESWGSRIVKYNESLVAEYTTDNGLTHGNTTDLIEDNEGNIWISHGCSGKGVTKFDGENFTQYLPEDGLGNEHIWSLSIDKFNRIWAGSSVGYSVFDQETWQKYYFDGPLSDKGYIKSIQVDYNNNIWFGTKGGVTQKTGEFWKHHQPGIINEDDCSNGNIKCHNNFVFVYNPCDEGIYRYNGLIWSYFTHGSNVFEIENPNKIWMSMYNDSIHKEILVCQNLHHKKEYANPAINCITTLHLDKNNKLWVGTFLQGLWVIENDNWLQILPGDLTDNIKIRSIHVDSDDRIWLGCDSGLYLIDDGIISIYYPKKTSKILKDSSGNLWFANNEGILYRCTSEGIDSINIGTSFQDIVLDNNNNFYIESEYFYKLSIETGILEQVPLEKNINIYPNPTNGLINIDIPYKEYDLEVYDASGRLVIKESEISRKQYDLSQYKGVLYLRIIAEKLVFTEKVIVH